MNRESMEDKLRLDLSGKLPEVGSESHVGGSFDAKITEEYEIGFSFGEALEWSFELGRISGALKLSGSIAGTITLTCSRCLEEYEYPLDIDLDEHLLWLTRGEYELLDEYREEYVAVDGTLDLTPLLRDAICLTIPAKRLCRPECLGLCQYCGTNLNVASCECEIREIDARLKPLEDLKRKMEGENGG